MITEQPAIRNYSMTDADLAMFSSNLVNLMNRDALGFIGFGISSLAIDSFETLENSFEVYPSDEMLQADVMIATQAKDALRDQVLISCRSISLRGKNKWGENSPQYRKFAVAGINNLNDRELLFQARRVHLVGTGFLSSLASEGLTTTVLDDFEDLNESFELALNEQINKINARDIGKRERINLGNDVYDDVRKFCEIGKQIWASIDESKYNDYLQEKSTPSGLPGKIQNFVYNPTLHKFTWQADIAATSYEVQRTTDGAWSQIYAGPSPELVIELVPGAAQVRCRGINDAGSGAWSDVLDYMIQLGTPHITGCVFDSGNNRIVLTWDILDYASSYLIYQSEVLTGQPAGDYTVLDEPTGTTYYIDTPTSNTKQYFYIVAEYAAGGMESVPSNVVSVEIPVV